MLHDGERLRNWLAERGDIEELHADGELTTFSHAGDRESEAALLKADGGSRVRGR